MSLAALFGFIVVAAETIISPIPSDGIIHLPNMTFAKLAQKAEILGSTTQTTMEHIVTPVQPSHIQRHIIIALLGDSMIDTLGPGIPDVAAEIASRAAYITPILLNYGVGATNIDYGITRITRDYDYKNNHVPALVTMHPDIVIVESFGYNPYPFQEGAIDRHWMALASVIDTLKKNLPNARIAIAATIAPDARTFGDGAAGIAFSPLEKQQHVSVIKSYLDSTVKFAQSQNLPLIDAYHDSLLQNGNGKAEYINPNDHIHPSGEGKKYFARKVADTLFDSHLLE